MIVQNNFLKKVKELGLNTYEAKLWAALLSRGVSTAGELSDIANVPRSRSYDVLESLEKKGFIIMKIAKPIKYLAVPPEEVMDRVKKKILIDAQEKHSAMDEIKSSTLIDELTLLHQEGIKSIDPQDITGAVRGRTNIYNHLDYLIKESKKEVIITTTEEGLIRKYAALKKSLQKASKRGVKILINSPVGEKSKELLPELKRFASINDVKTKSRFCIVDGQHAVMMLSDDKEIHPSFDSCIWVNSTYLSNMLKESAGMCK